MSLSPSNHSVGRFWGATTVVILGAVFAAMFGQACLSERLLASLFIRPETWFALVHRGHPVGHGPIIPETINITFLFTFLPCLTLAIITWTCGAGMLVLRRKMSWIDALTSWGLYGWIWWMALDLWEWLRIFASLTGWTSLNILLTASPQFWFAGCLACWISTGLTIGCDLPALTTAKKKTLGIGWLWCSIGLYASVFTAMNWQLYFNLLTPHGDSVMYEEHLWNLLHGKGFCSYLDQGLFLGEHIQFVHLFLLPVYLAWPTHLALEACSSTALACGAFPVFWMVRRQTNSDQTAFAAAVAYLLYSPMQYLDIEVDLKTFRPESFGIPLLLLTLDQLDRRNIGGILIGIAFCLTVKEDYTLIFGPLGIWIAMNHVPSPDPNSVVTLKNNVFSSTKSRIAIGMAISVFSVFYLWLATRVIMPWFRSGAEIHYASYFARFGQTPDEIVRTLITRPDLVFEALFTAETAFYAISLLAPLGFLPLLAPGRLSVALPLFGILCLNELDGSRTPQHQFHAPLVAIVMWSLAAAIPRGLRLYRFLRKRFGFKIDAGDELVNCSVRNLVWTSALATGIFFGISPLSMKFWDPNSNWYWERLYGSNHRAEMFSRIENLIPDTARVASTDFCPHLLTHYHSSYDYSDYSRKVNGKGNRVPDDTDYIVIDTDHRYSKIKLPKEIPELRDHPDRWELLPDQTEGCFIVLKRRKE